MLRVARARMSVVERAGPWTVVTCPRSPALGNAAVSDLEQLVALVLAAPKYRAVCPDTVRRLGGEELAKRPTLKAAVKATKTRLHQAFGAFVRPADHDRILAALEAACASGRPDAIRAAARSALACHASTRERLPFLDRFHPAIFQLTGTPRRILDLACGLHPLAIPWMGLPPDATYVAADIDGRAVQILNRAFSLLRVNGRADHADILVSPPADPADVAFLLKTLAGLERQRKGSARPLLESIPAAHLVVSYPVASLGGAGKGMRANYEREFRTLAEGAPWHIARLDFPAELVFVIRKP